VTSTAQASEPTRRRPPSQALGAFSARSYFGTKILGYSFKMVGIPDGVDIGNDVLAFDPAQMRAAFGG